MGVYGNEVAAEGGAPATDLGEILMMHKVPWHQQKKSRFQKKYEKQPKIRRADKVCQLAKET